MPADARAEALGYVCRTLGEDVALDTADAAAQGLTWEREQHEPDAETLELACVCVAAGRELRGRQWDALGDFLALYGMPAATTTASGIADAVRRLSTRDAGRLLQAALLLGWTNAPAYADGDSFYRDNDQREP